ncbi:PQQ-binding-like beta-propeller repeat protein, partial [Phenylobacterium sp.]|uniref:outer membrane protein assembly factor BamB family protein n=1 Tax=Phenylobacterium sp. TaxID=1871053 RepID=UPI001205F19B
MGAFAASGAAPALGATRYAERCARCHDAPSGRTPAKAAIANNTPTFIVSALLEGVMRPMAAGLSPHEMASVAAYLSTRKAAGLGAGALEAPACAAPRTRFALDGPSWNGWGNAETQDRFQAAPGLTAADVPRLTLKWAFTFAGSRNGQATVAGGRVFLASTSGAVYALDAKTGCAFWRFDIPGGSRSSVTVARLPGPGPARYAAYLTGWTERTAYALDADTGALIWKRQVDDQQEVQMTGSPVLHAGRLYVPISSAEEAIATDDTHVCCRFRGAVVAVDARTGAVAWERFMAPPAQPFKTNPRGKPLYGPAGAAIWAAPTVDAARGLLYVATGDSYTDAPLDTADAVVALDLATGRVRWVKQLTKGDNHIIGCSGPKPAANCPERVGPDHDFGVSPILHRVADGRDLLLVGQKSSEIYALDPGARGRVVWRRRLSSGGPLGGVEFGPAADRTAYFVGLSDVFASGPAPGVYAFRLADGAPLWSSPSPKLPCAWATPYCSGAVSQALTAMPGVVFAGAMNGRLRAYDTRDGMVLWEIDTAKPVMTVTGSPATGGVLDGAGPTIAGGTVYVVSGLVVDTGLHSQGWSRERAIKYVVDVLG